MVEAVRGLPDLSAWVSCTLLPLSLQGRSQSGVAVYGSKRGSRPLRAALQGAALLGFCLTLALAAA